MEIKHVTQRGSNDCVLTCIEMITGVPVPVLVNEYNVNIPTPTSEMEKVLCCEGFLCIRNISEYCIVEYILL